MTSPLDHNSANSNGSGGGGAGGGISSSSRNYLFNCLLTENLGGPSYRVKWSGHYNNAWIFEGCDGIAIREGTQNLFEHLVASKVKFEEEGSF